MQLNIHRHEGPYMQMLDRMHMNLPPHITYIEDAAAFRDLCVEHIYSL